MTITLDALESFANEVVANDAEERERLTRMICCYCRIIAVREPSLFSPRELKYGDENGHGDSSVPPSMCSKDHNGPRLWRYADWSFAEVATSGGFYYDWDAVPGSRGVFIDRTGGFFGAAANGSGRFGQFAARPGNAGVSIELEWEQLDDENLSTDTIAAVEAELRAIAFPLSQGQK